MNRIGDNIAFALLVGIPLAAVGWGVTEALAAVLGAPGAWIIGGAAILAWPIYYVSMTYDNRFFVDGLGLLLFSTPAMMVGWIAAPARVSRR